MGKKTSNSPERNIENKLSKCQKTKNPTAPKEKQKKLSKVRKVVDPTKKLNKKNFLTAGKIKIPLSRMQPLDLKKIFSKMESRAHSKIHRTSKWVDSFLNTNMNDVLIYNDNFSKTISMNWQVPGQVTAEIKNYTSGQHNSSHIIELKRNVDLSFTINSELPSCGTNFMFNRLYILGNHKNFGSFGDLIADNPDEILEPLLAKFVSHLAEKGIKRVNCLQINQLKPTDAMFKTWKPSSVQVHGLGDVRRYALNILRWNLLSGRSLRESKPYSTHFEEGSIEEGFEKLGRYCRRVEVSLPYGEEVPSQRIANLIEKFHFEDIVRDSLVLQCRCTDKSEFERLFPNLVRPIEQNAYWGSRYFVYPGREHSTFVEIRSQGVVLAGFYCYKWRNLKEAENFLLAEGSARGTLSVANLTGTRKLNRSPWKAVLDQCFK